MSQDNANENQHKSTDQLYLDKLVFDPSLRKSWLNFFVTNFRVVILLILLLTAWGIYSFLSLPRESNPEVKIPIALIATVYPGASPADMEELVTKKIETSISGLKGIDKITSNSSNSLSTVKVEFDSDQDLDDAMRRLRDKVGDAKKNLPTDANDPSVLEISLDDTPIWTASFSSPVDGFTLRQEAESIQDELEKIPGVREVKISGGDQRELEIAYDPQRLTYYGLSPDQANQLVKAANIAVPAGSFEGSKFTFPVRSDGRFWEAETLSNLPLFHTEDGAQVLLKDIAKVEERPMDKTVYSRYAKDGASQDNLTIQVVKKTGGNIVKTAESIESKMDEMVAKMPSGTSYTVITDLAEQIEEDFNHLTRDFLLTITLVFLVLFLIVGFKEAVVAGLAVPLVFFATFGVMNQVGITLNFLSMFSLILALGLLVDDAIVVVSATKQYMNTGKFTPEEAVLLVLNDFKVVLLTTTLTTVWAFLPLLVSTGIIGEFIKSIPITVSTTLIASLIIALVINHPLAAVLERIRMTKNFFWVIIALLIILAVGSGMIAFPYGLAIAVLPTTGIALLLRWYLHGGNAKLEENRRQSEAEWRDDELIKSKLRTQASGQHENFLGRLMHGLIKFDRLLPIYEKYLRMALATKKSRWSVLGGVFLLFCLAVALPATGIVKNEFFPLSDSDTISIGVEAPTGLNLDQTDAITRQVESKLMSFPDVESFSTIVGTGGSGSALSGGSFNNPSNLASITVTLKDSDQRTSKSYELAEKMQSEFDKIKEATVSVSTPRGGPPSGADFEAQISGDDLEELDRIANELKPELASIKGVANPKISLKLAPADYTFQLDPARMELYGLNAAYIGSVLRMAISGTQVTSVIREGEEIKVVARFQEEKLPNLESIQNLQILNTSKQPVFLKDVATIRLEPSVDTITHIDKKRTVVLSSTVSGTSKPADVVSEFQERVAKNHKLPDGYAITYGGQNEQNAESVYSILQAMLIAGLLIVSTLVIQFNSFSKAIIVLVTIPLGLIGVFLGLALLGIDLSFPGLIGIVALFGIVVKNAIILVDKINLNLKSGIPFADSIIDAGKSRLEAIFITSICTILGMIPITISNATWTALGSAVIFGLMLSSFFTLFVVPTLFMTFIKDKRRVDGPVNEMVPQKASL